MEVNQFSMTSVFTSWLRAYHSVHSPDPLFDDFLAARMVSPERQRMIEEGFVRMIVGDGSIPDDVHPVLDRFIRNVPGLSHVLSRARYAEERVLEAADDGFTQYAVLGAGLDTFALRHPELESRLSVFELDHPATREFKLDRLGEISLRIPSNLFFIPADFASGDLSPLVSHPSYDVRERTVFSWLGVAMYLTADQVFAILGAVAAAAPAGSRLVFDYLDADAADPGTAALRVGTMIRWAAEAGEPFRSFFVPGTLEKDLARLGFRVREHLSPADIERRYFSSRTDGMHACEHVHFVEAYGT